MRAKIVAMHRDETPLLEMIDALGLTRYLDADGLRDVIVGLDASEVATIRDAFVAEAAAAGVGAQFTGVTIVAAEAARDATGPIARIVPA